MKRTIAIYFSDPEPLGYPFDKQEYLDIYREIARDIGAQGVDVRIVRADSYQGKGRFSHGWALHPDGKMDEVQNIQASLILNRDDKNTIPRIMDCPIINHPDFDDLCLDKVLTARTFPALSPKTASCNSWEEYASIMADWDLDRAERIVLKKNFETEGRGVHIISINDVTESLYDSWSDILIQEFIDSSAGIPGITDKHHDLRITVVDGQSINSYLRTPAEGKFLANVAQGGTGSSVDFSLIPAEVLAMVNAIIAEVTPYSPVIFAADFMNSPNGYKLVELNSRPAVQHPSWSASYKQFNDALVEMLVKAVR